MRQLRSRQMHSRAHPATLVWRGARVSGGSHAAPVISVPQSAWLAEAIVRQQKMKPSAHRGEAAVEVAGEVFRDDQRKPGSGEYVG